MRNGVYVVGGDDGYANWLPMRTAPRIKEASLVLFTGGSDVDPALYGKKVHPETSYYPDRDEYEVMEFQRAREFGLPMLGICRGAQFLCVMSGGELIQHQRHPYHHGVKTCEGTELQTNSTHHQRAYIKPIEDKVELLAWADHISPFSYGESWDDKIDDPKEVEVAYYKETNCLGIQGHPEMLHPAMNQWEREFVNFCKRMVAKYLKV